MWDVYMRVYTKYVQASQLLTSKLLKKNGMIIPRPHVRLRWRSLPLLL